MRTTVYLDTQEFTYCVEPRLAGWSDAGLSDLRAAIEGAIQTDRLVFVGSQFHLEEMSRINSKHRLPILQFFWAIVRWNMLLPTVELAKAEVAAGRALKGTEPFDTFILQQQLKKFSLKSARYNAMATEIATLNDATAARVKKMREEMRLKLKANFPVTTPEAITEEWFKNPVALFQDWAEDYLENSSVRYGLSADRSFWPDPANLPTIRAIVISNLARIYLQLAENRKIGPGDSHDSHHYAAASYADVLVTEDRALRDTLAKIPHNTMKVWTFVEFAATVGVSPH